MTAPLSVFIDVEEPRVTQDRLVMLTDGRQWDLANSSGVSEDVVTFTSMLVPAPLDPNWFTSSAGAFSRLRKSALSIAGSANWTEYSRPRFDGDYYLHALGVNEPVITLAAYPKNRGFWLSWQAYNAGNDQFEQMRCTWGTGTTAEITLSFYANGSVKVYKNGALLDTSGNITVLSETLVTDLAQVKIKEKGASQQTANDTIDVLLIPFRKRELLVLSNQGGGFTVLFEDIDENDPDPTITGPGPFAVYQPSGQATVSLAPIEYTTSGYLVSQLFSLRYAPQAAQSLTMSLYYDLPGYGSASATASLVQSDGVTAFVADGTAILCRIRVDLTGDGDASPWIYGAAAVFGQLTANTVNTPTRLDPNLLRAEYSVPESPADVRFTATVSSPEALEIAGASRLREIGNRPLSAYLGSVPCFVGRTEAPHWSESVSDEARECVLECRDRWLANEKYLFQEQVPLDGLMLGDGFATLAKLPGYKDSDMDIEFIDFQLPTVAAQSKGEWALLPQVGDNSAQWIQKLWETYAQLYYYGWVPTANGPKFRVRSPSGLGTAPSATLFPTDLSAQNVGGLPPGAYPIWYYAYDEKSLEPETNDIYVVGRNPKTGLPLLSHYADAASQDPTTPVNQRPDNWLGEIRRYSWVDPAIITIAAANWAVGILRARLMKRRVMAEWKCQFLLKPDLSPVWRGDVVELWGKGRFRVNSLSGSFLYEHASQGDGDPDTIFRDFTYTGERVDL